MTDQTMKLWNALAPVDRSFTKPITGKSYKGDSPNPTYIIRKLTEHLGPVGRGWGFNVKFDRVREGAPHQIITEQSQEMQSQPDAEGKYRMKSKTVKYQIIREEYHEVCIGFWFADPDGNPRTFDCFGGTPMLYITKNGRWMHDEDAAKKSLTDAYTKGASWLGACADIFLGIFDDKYTSQPDPNGGAQQHQQPPQGQGGGWVGNPPQNQNSQPQQQQSSPPVNQNNGWDGNPDAPMDNNDGGQRQNTAPAGWG